MAKVAIYTPTLVVFWLWPCWYYSEISSPRSHYLSAPCVYFIYLKYRHSFLKVVNIIFINLQAVEDILFSYLLLIKLPLRIVIFHINTKRSFYLLYGMHNLFKDIHCIRSIGEVE